MEGGFDLDDNKFELDEQNCIVVLPEWTEISVSDPQLPGEVGIFDD